MFSIGLKRVSEARRSEISGMKGEVSTQQLHEPHRTMRDVALLLALGLLMTCPVLIYGAPDLSHDALDHARWAKQFATQFWHGRPVSPMVHQCECRLRRTIGLLLSATHKLCFDDVLALRRIARSVWMASGRICACAIANIVGAYGVLVAAIDGKA